MIPVPGFSPKRPGEPVSDRDMTCVVSHLRESARSGPTFLLESNTEGTASFLTLAISIPKLSGGSASSVCYSSCPTWPATKSCCHKRQFSFSLV